MVQFNGDRVSKIMNTARSQRVQFRMVHRRDTVEQGSNSSKRVRAAQLGMSGSRRTRLKPARGGTWREGKSKLMRTQIKGSRRKHTYADWITDRTGMAGLLKLAVQPGEYHSHCIHCKVTVKIKTVGGVVFWVGGEWTRTRPVCLDDNGVFR
jgi:hypothetical protein